MKFYPSLHVLRGLAALSVVLLHVLLPPRKFQLIGYFGTYLFFVLSGFVTVWITRNVGGVRAALHFVGARVRRTVPPYWAALLFAAALYGGDYPASFLFDNMRTVNQQLLPVAWSLEYEWRFYGLFAVCCVLLRFPVYALALPWLAVLVWFHNQHPVGFTSSNLFGLPLGALLGSWVVRWGGAGTYRVPLGLSLLGLSVSLARGAQPYGEFVYPLCAVPLILAAIRFDAQVGVTYPRVLMLLGDYSYAIYLTHVPIIWYVKSVIL